ncbi:MAG: winged helix-turn-helix domain-containing protein [Rhizobiales bacterium]|nr:winged helix-turn-helix domain-containing protein [Hyphomicrobiales bacterium]
MRRLDAGAARRLALRATGLDRGRRGEVGLADVCRLVRRLGVLQIDSVNVLVRAHYLPLFSRLGAYDMGLLDKAASGRRRALFEYWGHECSLLPVESQPLFRWRMADAAQGKGIYRELARFGRERADVVARTLERVRTEGPLSAGAFAEDDRGPGGWWGWGEAKHALELLFWRGELTTRERLGAGFARVYDLSERVLPAAVMAAPTPERRDAIRALATSAVRALGVASVADVANYYRLASSEAGAALEEAREEGSIVPAEVADWSGPVYIDGSDTRVPRAVEARALLAPFDPLVWDRARAERLFGFHYRIEIYTPAERRRHGYYVLPFLLGDRLVARVCLKADRKVNVLKVNAAFHEPGELAAALARPLAEELEQLAGWLDLEMISVGDGPARGREDTVHLTDDLASRMIAA